MKFLFVTYCFDSSQGQAMIGVYKRALRLAMELYERGHEIVFFCTGHEQYEDSLTIRAKQCMEFVDFQFFTAEYEGAEENRRIFVTTLAAMKPDVVVIGEAPMIGPLLEATLSAVELKIPTVCLDNAYQSFFVQIFWQNHGPMFDGMILNGPSSLHWKEAPAQLLQVPPFIEASTAEAESLLTNVFGHCPEKLVTVLAYDLNVARLATSLFTRFIEPSLSVLYIGSEMEQIRQMQEQLPAQVRSHSRAIVPPPERALFGLIKLSKFAVTKCAYMQVTECLSLGTPVISYFYPGYFPLSFLPHQVMSYAYATDDLDLNDEVVAVAARYLKTSPEDLLTVHNGELGALPTAARFIENLAQLTPQNTAASAAQLGFSEARIKAALRRLDPTSRSTLELREVHSTRLRFLKGFHSIYSLLCHYSAGGEERCARLWGHTFPTAIQTILGAKALLQPKARRQLLCFSLLGRILIERDVGVDLLPSYLMR